MLISPQYIHLSRQIETLPQAVDQGNGQLIFNGRNKIWLITIDDNVRIVVKRFKKHFWIKQLIYTYFRKNKALRSFENAQELIQRGYDTPRPIAYWEKHKHGILSDVYYACEYTDAEAIRPRLIDREDFDKELATAYAQYVANMHENGVLHLDLNPTNVLYTENQAPNEKFHFQLIDLNRMKFYDGAVPKAECMENLTLLWRLTDVFRFFVNEYAKLRHWSKEDIATVIHVKKRHDRRWNRRKTLTSIFKRNKVRMLINSKYMYLDAFIRTIPKIFDDQGKTIYKKRNEIKLFHAPDGKILCVKCYCKPNIINRWIYSLGIRKPKGLRAYQFPALMKEKGIDTPESVAYIECRRYGILRESYFISLKSNYEHNLFEVGNAAKGSYEDLAIALARFTADIHEKKVMHRDFSPGNILYTKEPDGTFHFQLVDTNRMYFGYISQTEGLRNLRKLWGPKRFFTMVIEEYARICGYDCARSLEIALKARRNFWTAYGKKHIIHFNLEL